MAHLQFTDEATRLELNLSGDEVAGVVEFLLGLISARVREDPPAPSPTTSPAPGVAVAEEVYAGSPFGQKAPGFGHITAETTPGTKVHTPEVARPIFIETNRTVSEEEQPPPRCESRHKGRRCYLTAGHADRHRDAYQRWDDDAPKEDIGPLQPRVCAREGCDVEFQPKRIDSRFHSKQCKQAQLHLDAKARKAAADPGGSVQCPECPRTFKTPQALGGHMNAHKGTPKAEHVCSCGRLFATPEARAMHQEDECGYGCHCGRTFASEQALKVHKGRSHAVAAPDRRGTAPIPRQISAVPEPTPPKDRPYRCKVDGCGHPCRSQGELNSHRIAYHDPAPVTKVTETISALTFPCPEAGCDRTYEDSNRLAHHVRVTHDPPVAAAHEVVVHGRHHVERVG